MYNYDMSTENKRCNKCQQEKEHYSYQKYMCKDCFSIYKKKHHNVQKIIKERKGIIEKRNGKRISDYQIKLKEYLLKLKQDLINHLGGCCSNCGYNKSIYALEFHHRNPSEKEFSIGVIMNRKGYLNVEQLKKLMKEVDKCKVLCCNCHKELHRDATTQIIL